MKKSDEPPRNTSSGHSSAESPGRPKRKRKPEKEAARPVRGQRNLLDFTPLHSKETETAGVAGATARIMEAVQTSRHPYPPAMVPHVNHILDRLQEDGFHLREVLDIDEHSEGYSDFPKRFP